MSHETVRVCVYESILKEDVAQKVLGKHEVKESVVIDDHYTTNMMVSGRKYPTIKERADAKTPARILELTRDQLRKLDNHLRAYYRSNVMLTTGATVQTYLYKPYEEDE